MRILHLIEHLGPGGKERQIVELLRGQSSCRVRCTIFSKSRTSSVPI